MKVLTPVNICSRFVTLYNLNRHVINKFNATYGVAKSHLQMNSVLCMNIVFSSVNLDWLILLLVSIVCVCVCVYVFFHFYLFLTAQKFTRSCDLTTPVYQKIFTGPIRSMHAKFEVYSLNRYELLVFNIQKLTATRPFSKNFYKSIMSVICITEWFRFFGPSCMLLTKLLSLHHVGSAHTTSFYV